jgi:hypothetical protein
VDPVAAGAAGQAAQRADAARPGAAGGDPHGRGLGEDEGQGSAGDARARERRRRALAPADGDRDPPLGALAAVGRQRRHGLVGATACGRGQQRVERHAQAARGGPGDAVEGQLVPARHRDQRAGEALVEHQRQQRVGERSGEAVRLGEQDVAGERAEGGGGGDRADAAARGPVPGRRAETRQRHAHGAGRLLGHDLGDGERERDGCAGGRRLHVQRDGRRVRRLRGRRGQGRAKGGEREDGERARPWHVRSA